MDLTLGWSNDQKLSRAVTECDEELLAIVAELK
jgi:hypothetical protein